MSLEEDKRLAFGPVPSRRLGQSLGINNIPPPKTCTYSCVYCQVGRTRHFQLDPGALYDPQQVAAAVRSRIRAARSSGARIDYLTFVANGEPTLDDALKRTIGLLKPEDLPIAVITNGSLIDRPRVRRALLEADWVSLKVDSVDEEVWHRINRPHPKLHLPSILQNMLEFRGQFQGTLVTETMLIRDLNDREVTLSLTAEFLERLNPDAAYLSIPTRPPAESWAQPPDETCIARAFQIFNSRIRRTEYLIGYEGNAFACSGDAEADLLSITAVHPMREEAVIELLDKTGSGWDVVRKIIDEDKLIEIEFERRKYYLRKLPRDRHSA